jgi:tetrahydromethanopterin S-methyltransferase subunit G
VERSADNDSPTGPTPLSEPLELKRVPFNPYCEKTADTTDVNAEQIEKRDAEIVVAIAKLEQKIGDAALLAGLYRKEVAAMQEQISAQADLQDEMQVAIDQIRSVQDAANGIYYEIQRDDIRPMQERLDALEGNVKSINGEVSRLFNSRVDKIDKRR